MKSLIFKGTKFHVFFFTKSHQFYEISIIIYSVTILDIIVQQNMMVHKSTLKQEVNINIETGISDFFASIVLRSSTFIFSTK